MSKLEHTQSEELTLQTHGYYLGKTLGEGSYGRVYLSEYRFKDDSGNKEKQIACKIIDVSKAPKDFVKKFLPRELAILTKINHPHLINVYSIFQRKAKYFIFMRFAENGDLLEFILKHGAVSEQQAKIWMRQLCLAIQYLHHMEIAHRDLKCENALITINYNLKISDFGFARYVIDMNNRYLTSDTYCGSLSYAAPEILKGKPYHPKIADIWSLGIILYIMLNKAMPFDDGGGGGGNIKRLYEQQVNRQWKFRAKIINLLTDEVKQLVQNLLEPDIRKRWTVDQVLQCSWFKLDPKLLQLNKIEQAALVHAQEERKNYIEHLRTSKSTEEATAGLKDELNVIKDDHNVFAKRLNTDSSPSIF